MSGEEKYRFILFLFSSGRARANFREWILKFSVERRGMAGKRDVTSFFSFPYYFPSFPFSSLFDSRSEIELRSTFALKHGSDIFDICARGSEQFSLAYYK